MNAVRMCGVDFGERDQWFQDQTSQFQYVHAVFNVLFGVQIVKFIAVASHNAEEESTMTMAEDGFPSLMIITPEINVQF